MALALVINFYVSQNEILKIGGVDEEGSPCNSYMSPHPPPSQKKATLNSQDFRISGVDSSANVSISLACSKS